MNTLKPYQLIASKFQISEESAKYFLGRVQKSFRKEKPPHALILEFIEAQEIELQPEPYDIAALMNERLPAFLFAGVFQVRFSAEKTVWD